MATCPNCGTSSRKTVGAITITPELLSGPIPGFAMTAEQLETVKHYGYRMSCRCGWSVTGHIEGDHLVVDRP